jgi:hypothetical protein
MGYHLTILKSSNGRQVGITAGELERAVETLPRFSLSEHGVARDGDNFLRFDEGELWLANPEERDLADMLALAKALDARVRGDEFETYESAERAYTHPDDVPLRQAAQAESDAMAARFVRQQKWFRNGFIACFAVLGICAYAIGKWLEARP